MRIALGIAYDGSAFHGWQSQPDGNTVQDRLEQALAQIAGAAVRTIAAGRTDTGVHATGQVVHFDAPVERPESAWVRGVNAHLPNVIAVQWARRVDDAFHARFAARSRTYRYVLYNAPVRPALFAAQVGWYHMPLELEPMRVAAQRLIGEHDFSSFRAAECQADSPIKRLACLQIDETGPFLSFTLQADAFLHHMVRNVIGALVVVGSGRQRPEWVGELLDARDRRLGAPTFSPAGLYLVDVEYDAHFGIPSGGMALPWTARRST